MRCEVCYLFHREMRSLQRDLEQSACRASAEHMVLQHGDNAGVNVIVTAGEDETGVVGVEIMVGGGGRRRRKRRRRRRRKGRGGGGRGF